MNDHKTERLTLRLTPSEQELLQLAADRQGMSLKEFITATVLARAQAVIAPATTLPGNPQLPEQLTLHQAAELLNASPSYMKGLLEQAGIPHHGQGASLRIERDSLLAYKARDDQERQRVLDELAREAQEQSYGY